MSPNLRRLFAVAGTQCAAFVVVLFVGLLGGSHHPPVHPGPVPASTGPQTPASISPHLNINLVPPMISPAAKNAGRG